MRTRFPAALLAATLPILLATAGRAQLLGSAFTYQGRLTENSQPANGYYDLSFQLFDAATGGNVVGLALGVSGQLVENGLFTAELDFGAGVFDGRPRWLQLAAKGQGEAGWETLLPRQPVTAAPYALRALNVDGGAIADGSVTAGKLAAGAVTSLAIADGGIFPDDIAAGSLPSALLDLSTFEGTFWKVGGNDGLIGGTFALGTTDNQPFELIVSAQRAFRIEPTSSTPNVLGGYEGNGASAGVTGATIGGGGHHDEQVSLPNRVTDHHGTIGGGTDNQAGDDAGGPDDAVYATVGGGVRNRASGVSSTIGGGYDNSTSGIAATAGGGTANRAEGDWAAVAGGQSGTASGWWSHVGGGQGNVASGYGSVVAGGFGNTASSFSPTSLFGGSTVGGGKNNLASGPWSVIAGGRDNVADYDRSSIGGGLENTASGFNATVPGGIRNKAMATNSFAAGDNAQALHRGAFVWADSPGAIPAIPFASIRDNEFAIRAAGGLRLHTNTGVSFGSATRQMLNLYGTTYGVGVQAFTLYQRSNDRFSWFRGGSHSDAQSDPGPGGEEIMRLTQVALYLKGDVIAKSLLGTSDVNAKENFAPVDSREILEQVVSMPMHTWNYKSSPADVRHLGPTAQDFHAAFGLHGDDDKHIATVDADGVALAAIQGLNRKLESELSEKQRTIDELEERVRSLERAVQGLLEEGAQR